MADYRRLVVDGHETAYLDTGSGEPVVLLHGGEFGADAALGWEYTVDVLAHSHRVIAPDMLGYGRSAKVVDFTDGRGLRIRHVAALLAVLGVDSAHFVGNSMGAINLLVDQTAARPRLRARSLVAICGGGEILRNEHVDALYDYDATTVGMRRIVAALFQSRAYPADVDYVRRRHESSVAPGAWEALAAARFRRPGADAPSTPAADRDYHRIAAPTLFVEGAGDKLLPAGWADELAHRVPRGASAVVPDAGHCPQLEQPAVLNALLLDFLARHADSAERVTDAPVVAR
ncbi:MULTISPECIES: alpha/beta fold hydrolase [unclassified Nocardia]|uniref:alpha/beta fold hydrolase n=1 Tax=unclassified Nocardia TaxID=2637762 RepID=UPI00369140D9